MRTTRLKPEGVHLFISYAQRGTASLLVLSWLLIVSGCASTGSNWGARESALSLAKSGQEVSTTAQGALGDLRNRLDRYVEGLYVESVLTNKPAPEQKQIDSIWSIQKSITLREQALADLANLYRSFEKLATYEAAAAVETGLNDLTGSVNALGTSVGTEKSPLSNVASGLISRVGGRFAQAAQADAMRKASAEIRPRLQRFKEHLTDQKKYFTSMREVVGQGNANSAAALVEAKIGVPGQFITDQLTGFGIDYSKDQLTSALADAATGKELRTLFGNVVKYRGDAAVARQEDLLDATIAAMDDLLAKHEAFENGEQLDLAGLTARIAQLRALVGDIQRWSAQDRETKPKAN